MICCSVKFFPPTTMFCAIADVARFTSSAPAANARIRVFFICSLQ
jgi:hypothetical protein